ncbi:hypothetical protein [Clostridium botulinum]|uniref:hypothetical protein n=1 Tax=Clostridium botulinum TaxID=1491 RepID=UPI001E3598E4|nr:hypothetical protein [Clostridium botulinum]MCD3329313.1 hypothetical protein [Clostridium botulinum D/C]MCD3344532.1 hypothetical protein [Clostridium botulinum D/C]MCD3353012.1 hypothetical protein [Clostridium botulinum D/C]
MDKQELNRIMNIDIDNLVKTQYDSLKKFILDKIDVVRWLVETEQYDRLKEIVFFSGQGDGYGNASENWCINFAYKDNDEMDLIEVTELLSNLKNNIKSR